MRTVRQRFALRFLRGPFRYPACLKTCHPFIPDECILQRIVQDVPMWSTPVTFGGGMTIVYGFFSELA
jgi:hypothetical protein